MSTIGYDNNICIYEYMCEHILMLTKIMNRPNIEFEFSSISKDGDKMYNGDKLEFILVPIPLAPKLYFFFLLT
jgi:hypothetical protein